MRFVLSLEDWSPRVLTNLVQAGVGTYFEPGVVSPVFEWVAKILDLAFAWYVFRNHLLSPKNKHLEP